MKKIVSIILSVLLLATVVAPAYAANLSDLTTNLNAVEKEQKSVSKSISQLASDIKALQAKVTSLDAKIKKTEKQIKKNEKEIELKEEEIEEREDNLYKRLDVMYRNGTIGFIDVLLGSNSISEFVSNVEMVKRIYQNDMDILSLLTDEHTALSEKKKQLEEKKALLKDQQKEAEKQRLALKEKKKELEKKEDELQAEADKLTYEIVKLMDANSPYIGGVFTWPCPSSTYIPDGGQYGYRMHPILKVKKFHSGIDIAAANGSNIVAAGAGKVIMAEWYGGYGNCVMIDHGGGIATLYGHSSKLLVKKGDIVSRGQVIALVGTTGTSTGYHLHFEVRENGNYVDPMPYLTKKK